MELQGAVVETVNGQTAQLQVIAIAVIESARELMTTMLGADGLEVVPVSEVDDTPRVSSVVGFSGTHNGNLAIHASNSSSSSMAEALLGFPVGNSDEDKEMVLDAMGEVGNMVAGGVKARLVEGGESFDFSLPTVVIGESYVTHAPGETSQTLIGVSAGNFRFNLQLVIKT